MRHIHQQFHNNVRGEAALVHTEPAGAVLVHVHNREVQRHTSRREITRDCARSYFVKGWAKNSKQVSRKHHG